MKSFIYILILIISLFFAAAAYPSEHRFPCGIAKDIMKKNFKDGFAYFSTATENNGFIIQLYINMQNGDWRIVGIDDKMHACNMLQGIEWQFLKIRSM